MGSETLAFVFGVVFGGVAKFIYDKARKIENS
jgi:hypothetical protein